MRVLAVEIRRAAAVTLLEWRARWHDNRAENLLNKADELKARARQHDDQIRAMQPAFSRWTEDIRLG